LFCQRAREADPAFVLAPEKAAAIAQICRRLDGIPLALELAAARLRFLSPDQIAERLDDRFRLLSGGARTALPHHQTLLATMDWSYELLAPAEQAVLRRLCVFPGSFSLDAAEAVAADTDQIAPHDVLDLLGHLVDKSLVVGDEQGTQARYRLLETVRQYGAERLAEAGETRVTRRRHRDFFLAMADATHDDLSFWWDTRDWLARVRSDDDNFRAALEWSAAAAEPDACLRLDVALSYYWVLEGVAGSATRFERGLGQSVPAMTPIRIRGLSCLAFFVAQSGDSDWALDLLGEARTLADQIGDTMGAGFACELLGGLHSDRGEFEEAERLLDEARRRFETADCVAGAWGCRYDRGWLALARGDHRRAAIEFEAALELGRRCESADLTAHSLAALAPVLALTGASKRAEALADEAIETARHLGLRLFVVMALTRAAEVAVLLEDPERARDALAESLTLLRDVGGVAWLADTLELVALLEGNRQPEAAVRLLGACDTLAGGRPSIRAIRGHIEQHRTLVAGLFEPEPFALEWARGQKLSAHEAAAQALATLMDASKHVR
jgi:non-specific serine/threonine protein kinase